MPTSSCREEAPSAEGPLPSTSFVVDRILNENLTMDVILDEDFEELVDSIGRDIVRNRTRHATLGLSTIKAAVRAYKKDVARR